MLYGLRLIFTPTCISYTWHYCTNFKSHNELTILVFLSNILIGSKIIYQWCWGAFLTKDQFFPLVHSCLSWSLEPCKNTRKCPLSGVFAADNSHYDVADIILELETRSIVRSMCICSDSDIYESQVKRVYSWEVNADVVKFVKIIFQWSWYSFE